MYDICVSLVNTNEREDIDRCLTSLYTDLKDKNFSLVIAIVDNASTDDIEGLLKEKFSDVVFLRQEKNEGFGKSHNLAMKKVEAKYYFILNPDTTFEPGSRMLQKMYDFMEANPKIGMLGPKIFYPDGSLQYSCWRFPTFLQPIASRTSMGKKGRGKKIADDFLMKDFDHEQTLPVDAIMGSAMFVRKAAIDEVGGFDDRFWMYFEDIDWCKRMWEHGWPVYYFPEVSLKHVHKRASAKVPGIVAALLKNRYARVHFISWLKYFWKWRGNHKFYAG